MPGAPSIILATDNVNKSKEILAVVGDLPFSFKTLRDYPGFPRTVEDGKTLRENAVKKSIEAALALGAWALADDTGLEVEALDGAPGIHSARYAGDECDFNKNNLKLLDALRGVEPEKRKAIFRCVLALCSPQGQVVTVEGAIEGRITAGFSGDRGFGYDPVFFVPSLNKTLAQMSFEEKNKMSHRWSAARKIRPYLENLIR